MTLCVTWCHWYNEREFAETDDDKRCCVSAANGFKHPISATDSTVVGRSQAVRECGVRRDMSEIQGRTALLSTRLRLECCLQCLHCATASVWQSRSASVTLSQVAVGHAGRWCPVYAHPDTYLRCTI